MGHETAGRQLFSQTRQTRSTAALPAAFDSMHEAGGRQMRSQTMQTAALTEAFLAVAAEVPNRMLQLPQSAPEASRDRGTFFKPRRGDGDGASPNAHSSRPIAPGSGSSDNVGWDPHATAAWDAGSPMSSIGGTGHG